jgi:hypothetical protein
LTDVVWTPEKAAEYGRLYYQLVTAVVAAGKVLGTHGMESEEFRKADAEATDLWVKLRELQGMAGNPWMA